MIRSASSNFVGDYAVWRYPSLFTSKKLTNGAFSVNCFLCEDFYCFERCKEVDDHVNFHYHNGGNTEYCGH